MKPERLVRILALDGGGMRAGILAKALGRFFTPETPGRDIVRQFSYVAANSGGSIVLAALCCNYTPGQIARFYDDAATLERLFCPRWTARIPVLKEFLPRYSTVGKLQAVREILDRNQQPHEPRPSTIKLTEWPKLLGSPVKLLVTAFDLDRQRATFFRSDPASAPKSSEPPVDVTLLDAVHASTTPPVLYFDAPATFLGHRYWDGGLAGYNNPVLAAVVEALANQPDAANAIRVLSIGTSTQARPPLGAGVPPPLGEPLRGACWLDAAKVATSVIYDDPPDAATFHAYVALRQPLPARGLRANGGAIVRASPFLRPHWDNTTWQLPEGFDASEFARLFEIRMDAFDGEAIRLTRKLTDAWMADHLPNQPIRMGAHFQCDIGDDTFGAAVEHWRAISWT